MKKKQFKEKQEIRKKNVERAKNGMHKISSN